MPHTNGNVWISNNLRQVFLVVLFELINSELKWIISVLIICSQFLYFALLNQIQIFLILRQAVKYLGYCS